MFNSYFLKLFCFLIFLIAFYSFNFLSQAKERKEFYNETRGLGMGGARIASVNDASAILVNPSALAKLRDQTLELVSPELSFNKKVLEVVNLNLLRSFNLKEIFNRIKEKKGSFFHQKIQTFPSFSFKNFGFGFLMKFELDEEILEDETKEILKEDRDVFVAYKNDLAFATGFSLPFYDGRLKLGAGLRLINRAEIEEFFYSDEIEDINLSSLVREGFGVAKDIGITFSIPRTYIPTFSAVWRDVGNTKYDFFDGFIYDTDKKPKKTPQSLDVGFSMISIFSGTRILTFSTEFRDLFNAKEDSKEDESDIMRRIHAGLELNLNDSFFIRLGMNQSYWTAGFEFTKIYYQWQLAAYGEDIGTNGNAKETRRVVFKFTLRL